MICDKCHSRIASVIITQIVDNKVVEHYLCEKCSNENNELLKEEKNNSFEQFLSGLINAKSVSYKNQLLKCEKCGMTIDTFKTNSKVGCSNCYLTFNNYFESLIKRIHTKNEHTGKRPNNSHTVSTNIRAINELKEELKTAILNEEYELAACLRDKIKALNEEGSK